MSGQRISTSLPLIEAEHRASVAAGFVRGLLSGARARGRLPGVLLAAAGLDSRHLEDACRTPIGAYAELYNEVVRALDDEAFGLFSAPVRPGAFEFLCRAAIGAPHLGEALARAGRFLSVVLPDLALRVEVEGAQARLVIAEQRKLRPAEADPRRVFAFEWLLRMLHGLACWLVSRGLTLETVRFPYPRPPHAAEYARVYTEHFTFGGTALVATFDAALLDLPVRRSEADLAAFLEGAPGKIAMLYRRDREVAGAVRRALARDLAAARDFEGVARALHLSPRTLHRRLAQEGTSFRAIKEALRREQALHALETSGKSIADVAAELGYSEPSAFFRAFVAWTGMAPSVYRKRNRSRSPPEAGVRSRQAG